MDYRNNLINLLLHDFAVDNNHLETLLCMTLEGFPGLRSMKIEELEQLVKEAYDHEIMEGEELKDFVENRMPTVRRMFRDDELFFEKEFHQ